MGEGMRECPFRPSKVVSFTFLTILIMPFAISAFGIPQTGKVFCKVKDEAGHNLPDATLTLTPTHCKCSDCPKTYSCRNCCAPIKPKLAPDGYFIFEGLLEREYQMLVAAPGFDSIWIEVPAADMGVHHEIILPKKQ